ncbi:MAG TPA: 5-formyltetrahydrofolate cyclo-ligase [Candidatus Sumerlaeia bacterium]|nr:5-formyltetrahydrofolate cyclo-ligase [Candidatus Sumerlaeia bacterium]
MSDISQDKKKVRLAIKRQISILSDSYLKNADNKIRENLFALKEFQKSKTVMTYLSIKGEVETLEFAREVLKRKKRLVVPKVQTHPKTLLACEINTLEEGLSPSRYGILEPVNALIRQVDPYEIELHVIPGLAFDKKGHRLGRGGGYYDRFLSDISPNAMTVGVCYECQFLESVPCDSKDVPVRCVVTERGVVYPAEGE